MMLPILDEATLDRLSRISECADPPPWRSMVEGRDHMSGDSFFMAGPDDDRWEDLYVTRDSGPADSSTLDLVATVRTYLRLLITEVKRLRVLGTDQQAHTFRQRRVLRHAAETDASCA